MNKLLLLGFLVFAPLTLASADMKVAVVDLSKAFDSFYKTKDFSAKIEAKKAGYQKEIQDVVADYQRMNDEAKKLYDDANDPTLAPAARDEKAKALQQKKQDLLNMQNKIQEMQTERSNEIKEELVRRHKDIVDEISLTISQYAGPQGYDLVLDKSSASSTSGVSLVIFSSSKLTDITDEVIKLLNATAPPPGTAPAPTTDSVPTPH